MDEISESCGCTHYFLYFLPLRFSFSIYINMTVRKKISPISLHPLEQSVWKDPSCFRVKKRGKRKKYILTVYVRNRAHGFWN